jgi:hypothetical protein
MGAHGCAPRRRSAHRTIPRTLRAAICASWQRVVARQRLLRKLAQPRVLRRIKRDQDVVRRPVGKRGQQIPRKLGQADRLARGVRVRVTQYCDHVVVPGDAPQLVAGKVEHRCLALRGTKPRHRISCGITIERIELDTVGDRAAWRGCWRRCAGHSRTVRSQPGLGYPEAAEFRVLERCARDHSLPAGRCRTGSPRRRTLPWPAGQFVAQVWPKGSLRHSSTVAKTDAIDASDASCASAGAAVQSAATSTSKSRCSAERTVDSTQMFVITPQIISRLTPSAHRPRPGLARPRLRPASSD